MSKTCNEQSLGMKYNMVILFHKFEALVGENFINRHEHMTLTGKSHLI